MKPSHDRVQVRSGSRGQGGDGRRLARLGLTALLVTSLAPSAAMAQDLAFLRLRATECEVALHVNGFPILVEEVEDGQSLTEEVTRILHSGANTLSVSFAPCQDFDPATDPVPRLGLDLVHRRPMVGEYRAVFLSAEEVQRGVLNEGAFDPSADVALFASGSGGQAFDFTYSDPDKFDFLPTRMEYFVADREMPDLDVEFSTAAGGQVVRYEGLMLPEGGGQIDFTQLTPSQGAQFLGSSDFARVRFEESGVDPLQFRSVYFERRDQDEVVSLELPGSDFNLDPELVGDGQVTEGEYLEGTFTFTDPLTTGRSAWAFTFPPDEPLGLLPSHITIADTEGEISDLRAEFLNDDGSHHVVYEGLPVPDLDESQTLDLRAFTPVSGAEWLNALDFTRIRFSAAVPDASVQWSLLSLRRRVFDVQQEFLFDLPHGHAWAWEGGDLLPPTLDPADVTALDALVLAVQDELVQKDADGLVALMDHKAQDVAELLGIPQAQAEAQQRDFYLQRVFADPGFAMLPVDPLDLVYEVVGDGQVVQVSHGARASVFQSVPILESGRAVIFRLDLRVSRFPDGGGGTEWRVVQ